MGIYEHFLSIAITEDYFFRVESIKTYKKLEKDFNFIEIKQL